MKRNWQRVLINIDHQKYLAAQITGHVTVTNNMFDLNITLKS